MKITKEVEEKILLGLFKYYTNDVTFERAAQDANISIVLFVNYINDNDLPIIHTDKDVTVGMERVVRLMKEKGMNINKLRLPA